MLANGLATGAFRRPKAVPDDLRHLVRVGAVEVRPVLFSVRQLRRIAAVLDDLHVRRWHQVQAYLERLLVVHLLARPTKVRVVMRACIPAIQPEVTNEPSGDARLMIRDKLVPPCLLEVLVELVDVQALVDTGNVRLQFFGRHLLLILSQCSSCDAHGWRWRARPNATRHQARRQWLALPCLPLRRRRDARAGRATC